jgi:hypothetical protein
VLKQIAVAITAALVLGTVGSAAALADNGADEQPGSQRVDRLHQHQGMGGLPGPNHNHNHGPHRHPADDHGQSRSTA